MLFFLQTQCYHLFRTIYIARCMYHGEKKKEKRGMKKKEKWHIYHPFIIRQFSMILKINILHIDYSYDEKVFLMWFTYNKTTEELKNIRAKFSPSSPSSVVAHLLFPPFAQFFLRPLYFSPICKCVSLLTRLFYFLFLSLSLLI